MTERPRRASRRSRPIDVTPFLDEVDAALRAFAADVSYATAMARNAVTITRKRAVWQARREIRIAEEAAHRECEATPTFNCYATTACGTGQCKFAKGELALLDVEAGIGPMRRPQGLDETYGHEEAVAALVERRMMAVRP